MEWGGGDLTEEEQKRVKDLWKRREIRRMVDEMHKFMYGTHDGAMFYHDEETVRLNKELYELMLKAHSTYTEFMKRNIEIKQMKDKITLEERREMYREEEEQERKKKYKI
jgi:hypothetical protein